MELLNYFLSSTVVCLGLVIGILLGILSPEELVPGRRFFIARKKILLILLLILPFYTLLFNSIILVVIATGIFGALILWKDFDYIFLYPLFAFLLHYSASVPIFFLIQSSILFVMGVPVGTLTLTKKERKLHIVNAFVSVFLFLALALLLNLSSFGLSL